MSRGPAIPRKGLIAATLGVFVLVLVLLPVATMMLATVEGDTAKRWSYLDGVIMDRMVNSIVQSLGATILSLLIGVPFAIALHRSRFFRCAAPRRHPRVPRADSRVVADNARLHQR